MAISNALRVGFPSRVYSNPEGNEPSTLRWNVVLVCSGRDTAPVEASTARPQWIAFVSKRIGHFLANGAVAQFQAGHYIDRNK
ncbi:hypothetical protein NKI24_28605 [Mesorhizobium sp. M0701]